MSDTIESTKPDLGIQTSDKVGELVAALAVAQGTYEAVKKDREGGTYGSKVFKYADWSDILVMVLPKLSAQGLVFVQNTFPCIEDGNLYVQSAIYHTSGQYMRSFFPVCSLRNTKQQEFGSCLTYAKRYGGSALLGISTEEDTDEQGSETKTEKEPKTPPSKARPQEKQAPPHDPATGEVKSDESETAKALYARITGDGIDGSMIGALGKEINETIKGDSRKEALRAALDIRLHVFNAVKESDLDACNEHLATIKKKTMRDTEDLKKIIEVKRDELKAASMTASMRDIGEDSRLSDGRANT